jgi:FlaA1/EpsC-like NDP-sugar epimerase
VKSLIRGASIARERLPFSMSGLRIPPGLLTRRTQFASDLVVLTASFLFAYLLRFDFVIPEKVLFDALVQLPYVVLIQVVSLALTGVYSFIWRYVGMREVRYFASAFLWSSLVLTALRLALPARFSDWRVPLSVILMGTTLGFLGVLGLRVARRALWESEERSRRRPRSSSGEFAPTLFFGVGEAGVLAAREVAGRTDTNLDVRGFIDDDPRKQGTVVLGIPVIGTRADLPRLVKALGITQVVITIARISRPEIQKLMALCQSIPVTCRTIPGFSEVLEGKVKVTRIRDVKAEDLFDRRPVELDEKVVGGFLEGKTVLVTGAGGSIGSELARQVIGFRPARILLVERSEFALFDVEQELKRRLRKFNDVPVEPLVADVGDVPRMTQILARYRPSVVFHAAAHKHVPMMEANPAEAIKNNVLATRRLGELTYEHGVETFVLISTDKAVRPSSIMGASKRVAELVIQDLARRNKTRFLAVRFGNVMDSAGSVIPTFREQIADGGPVTVTHPEMKRYFMTIPEAARLVLQAGALGRGGEILVLEMGEQVKILDVATALIKLTGLKPFEEMPIVFTGLRPGEKLAEELELSGEEFAKTRHPRILIGKLANVEPMRLIRVLERLEDRAFFGDGKEIRAILSEFLPEARLDAPIKSAEMPLFPETTGGRDPHAA